MIVLLSRQAARQPTNSFTSKSTLQNGEPGFLKTKKPPERAEAETTFAEALLDIVGRRNPCDLPSAHTRSTFRTVGCAVATFTKNPKKPMPT
jgi:hypothetical protein